MLASTPWADSGPFWEFATNGEDPAHPHTKTFRWKLNDAWWIVPEVVETARATLSPLQFRAEYEGEFVGASDAYFDHEDLLAAVADFPMVHDGRGMPATGGLDWAGGRTPTRSPSPGCWTTSASTAGRSSSSRGWRRPGGRTRRRWMRSRPWQDCGT